MIKRRFYRLEHGDKIDSSASSSSSDSEIEADAADQSDDNEVEVEREDESSSTSSGLPAYDDEAEGKNSGKTADDYPDMRFVEIPGQKSLINGKEESMPAGGSDFVLKCKSVFKCRICPKVVCLTEETLGAHLRSKKHSRSLKLLNEGRLRTMLNSDREIENLQVSAEACAETVAPVQGDIKQNRQRQSDKSRFRKKRKGDNMRKGRQSTKGLAKKRQKNGD